MEDWLGEISRRPVGVRPQPEGASSHTSNGRRSDRSALGDSDVAALVEASYRKLGKRGPYRKRKRMTADKIVVTFNEHVSADEVASITSSIAAYGKVLRGG